MRSFTSLGALPLSISLLTTFVSAQLGIEITKAVDCTRKTENGDYISVHYRGTLKDGTEFDASYGRGSPFEFKLGAGEVIQGWDQGLLGMCIGEGRNLTIPANLAYGSHAVGKIPAMSTLFFETELMGIKGVEVEKLPPRPTIERPAGSTPTPKVTSSSAAPISSAPPPPTSVAAPVSSAAEAVEPTTTPSAQGSPLDDEEDDGECRLLGSFALLVQGALGLLALSSLVYKRWRETPRRPLKIWFFDVSKQVVGSVLLHLANLLMSMLSAGDFDIKSKVQSADGKQPNPCSFYLLNLAIDTTIGIPILVLLLKVLHRAFLLTPLARPAESIRSGNYGHPPRATWWLKQCIIYFLGLIGMKFCVFIIFQLLPWIAWVGDWALRWTEGNTALQITFVMFIFPLIMNALQYWIIDGFIKDKSGGEEQQGYGAAPQDDEDMESDDEAWLERQRRREGGDVDSDVEAAENEPLKEANPTTVPVRDGRSKKREYDPSFDGASGSQ